VRRILFHPKARDVIRRFLKEARTGLGRILLRLQIGEQVGMPVSRQMPSVAAGVSEFRVNAGDGTFRVFYYTASRAGILVFYAFTKNTQRTPPLELDLAKKRLKELLDA
jgi:phage-related protein